MENDQMLVSVHGKKERALAIAWLENHGYQNVQKLTAETYDFPVFVLEKGVFFGTNTTCMAALCSVNKAKIVSWEQFLAQAEKN